jgi:hypothetical protein
MSNIEGETIISQVTRKPEEIEKRMAELRELMDQNDVWIQTRRGNIREPNAGRAYRLYQARLNELRWFLDVNVIPEDAQ